VTVTNVQITNFIHGIHLYHSSGSNISGNSIISDICIWVYNSDNNIISRNEMTSATYCCIEVDGGSNNVFSENDIVSCSEGIIVFTNNDLMVVYHNNFVDNGLQTDVLDERTYVWDNGYPSGGNYWSDYDGIDEKSGPDQDIPGSDGIGDTRYYINTNNRDRYPLMSPWSAPASADVSVTRGGEAYFVQMISNATVTNFEATPGSIRLAVSGQAGDGGYVRLVQPMGLNMSNIKVFLNNTKLSFPSVNPARSISTNGTHYFIYFEFTFNSSYELTVAFPVMGDTNYDGWVNAKDAIMLGMAFYPSGEFNPHSDINDDDYCNAKDAVILGMHFGQNW
jgi:parallel beta-helix repeat protein